MRVRLDLLPRDDYVGEVVLLVDVLRTATTAALLFEKGLERLISTRSLRESRRVAGNGTLLVGERHGVPPEGFNHSSSLRALQRLDFSGRSAVLLSDNAPRALQRVAAADTVYLASFFNLAAAARAAHESEAERVAIVCAGYDGEEDLDDSLVAGALAAEIARLGSEAEFEGAVKLALNLSRAFPDPMEALWLSSAGRALRSQELADDIAIASMIGHSARVPVLRGAEKGRHGDLFYFEAESFPA